MNISLDIPRPMSLRFLIAAFRGRRSLGLNSDRDTEVEDPDQETEVDDFAEVDDYEEYEDEGYDYNSHPPKHPRKWIGAEHILVCPVVARTDTELPGYQWNYPGCPGAC